MRNKRILITGMAGSVGSELLRQLAPENKIYGIDINETGCFDLVEEYQNEGLSVHGRVGDIRNEATVEEVFSDFLPQVVFHAAAYKHVTPMEQAPIEAIQTNIMGTYNILKHAKMHEVKKFVLISTDKAVSSNCIMGASKRMCEIMVKNQGKGFVVVRFGNVLGSRGSVIPLWQKQVDEGKPITITDPRMERYMMTIEQAVNLVITAGEMGRGGEIIILDMGRRVNVLELAKDVIKKSSKDIPIKTIGIRPGELLSEKLMFEEEEKVAIKKGNFYIIK
jgi:FlaA1/EpsC-like NDP-sugar epimerase